MIDSYNWQGTLGPETIDDILEAIQKRLPGRYQFVRVLPGRDPDVSVRVISTIERSNSGSILISSQDPCCEDAGWETFIQSGASILFEQDWVEVSQHNGRMVTWVFLPEGV